MWSCGWLIGGIIVQKKKTEREKLLLSPSFSSVFRNQDWIKDSWLVIIFYYYNLSLVGGEVKRDNCSCVLFGNHWYQTPSVHLCTVNLVLFLWEWGFVFPFFSPPVVAPWIILLPVLLLLFLAFTHLFLWWQTDLNFLLFHLLSLWLFVTWQCKRCGFLIVDGGDQNGTAP